MNTVEIDFGKTDSETRKLLQSLDTEHVKVDFMEIEYLEGDHGSIVALVTPLVATAIPFVASVLKTVLLRDRTTIKRKGLEISAPNARDAERLILEILKNE